ncbi:hypothetical protein [Flavobacterium sp.]
MKSTILSITLFALLMTACKNDSKETPEQTVPISEEKVTEKADSECYEVNKYGNIISLRINYDSDNVNGTLSYALQEKDKNTGTFVGQIKDSIIIADYTFQSEGLESVRQIAFKLKGNQAVEGYGEMNSQGTRFKDVSQLNFDGKMPMEKVTCSE